MAAVAPEVGATKFTVDMHSWLRNFDRVIKHQTVREFVAEFLGTFLLITFGN